MSGTANTNGTVAVEKLEDVEADHTDATKKKKKKGEALTSTCIAYVSLGPH